MTGELHEISRAIGSLEASMSSMRDSFDRHCNDDDRRHDENQQVARATIKEIAGLRDDLRPLAKSVGFMRPIVESYQLTRTKLAAWASIGFGIVVLLGWVVEAAIKWAVGLMLSHWH